MGKWLNDIHYFYNVKKTLKEVSTDKELRKASYPYIVIGISVNTISKSNLFTPNLYSCEHYHLLTSVIQSKPLIAFM